MRQGMGTGLMRKVLSTSLLLVKLGTLPTFGAAKILTDIPTTTTWVTDGTVTAIAHTSSTVYLAGEFAHVAPVTGSGVATAQTLDFGPFSVIVPTGVQNWQAYQ